MGEFRIGRSRAQHSYPESRRDTTQQFARNGAQGPAGNVDIASAGSGGTSIPWAAVEVGVPGTTVTITPRVTGRVRVSAVATVINNSEGSETVGMQVKINGGLGSVPLSQSTILASGFSSVPFTVETLPLPLNVPATFEIFMTAQDDNSLQLTDLSSFLVLEEISNPTG